jgi:hypothetical protein
MILRRWCCAKSPTDWAKLKTWMEEQMGWWEFANWEQT